MKSIYKTTNYDSVSEILKKINEIENKQEAVYFLKTHDNKSVRYFIDAYYNKDFSFMEGDIDHDYSREIKGMEYSNIQKEAKRLDTILAIGEKNKKTLKLCEILLESINKDDADLIKNALFNKQIMKIKKSVFKEVYPSFFL